MHAWTCKDKNTKLDAKCVHVVHGDGYQKHDLHERGFTDDKDKVIHDGILLAHVCAQAVGLGSGKLPLSLRPQPTITCNLRPHSMGVHAASIGALRFSLRMEGQHASGRWSTWLLA